MPRVWCSHPPKECSKKNLGTNPITEGKSRKALRISIGFVSELETGQGDRGNDSDRARLFTKREGNLTLQLVETRFHAAPLILKQVSKASRARRAIRLALQQNPRRG